MTRFGLWVTADIYCPFCKFYFILKINVFHQETEIHFIDSLQTIMVCDTLLDTQKQTVEENSVCTVV